jgi:HlyD family secretion protein
VSTKTGQAHIALVAAATAVLVGYRMATRPTTVHTEIATIANVRSEVHGPGTVQSRFAVSIGSQVTGKIERVLVDVGDEVQKGQVLVTLDATELEARVASARATTSAGRLQIALAQANLNKADADLELAAANYGRTRSLAEQQLIAAATLDQAKTTHATASANRLAARAAVDYARAQLESLVEQQRVAETVASYATITSPMSGVITRRALEPGSTVAAGTTVLKLVDRDSLWIATLIDESLVKDIEVGQPARIALRSGSIVRGHVARVAYEADPVTRELEVDVVFDERPPRFAIHEEADVVVLGRETHGVTVPLAALARGAAGDAMFVVEGGRALRRPVHVGVAGADRAEIVDGVRAGDTVILNPKAIRDGARVAVEAR